MKHRDFVYLGEPIPEIRTSEHSDFLLHLQKSMLLSLVKRNLLSASQMEQVMEKVERKT